MRAVPGPPRMSAQDRRQQLVDIGLDLLATRSIHELACGRCLAERELGLGEGDERIG